MTAPIGVGPLLTGAETGMRILVLDDHDAFRDEVIGILTRNGHEAQGVATAPAAIPLVENGHFDIVLVDYSMPQHDGIWFMRTVHRPKRTKAILVTAHVNREMIVSMFNAGISGYIIKPFDEDGLMRNLKAYAGLA
jgi:CheY-like chemotaxis protein